MKFPKWRWPGFLLKDALIAFVIIAAIWSLADKETMVTRAATANGGLLVIAGLFALKGFRAGRRQ